MPPKVCAVCALFLVLCRILPVHASRPSTLEQASLDPDVDAPATPVTEPADAEDVGRMRLLEDSRLVRWGSELTRVGATFSQREQVLAIAADLVDNLNDTFNSNSTGWWKIAWEPSETSFSGSLKGWLVDTFCGWLFFMVLPSLVSLYACYSDEESCSEKFEKDGVHHISEGYTTIMQQGHFDILSHAETCFWSSCCPCVRWADTISAAGLLGFWAAYWIFLGFPLILSFSKALASPLLPSNVQALWSLFNFLSPTFLILYFRMGIRQLLVPPFTKSEGCLDFFFICFCQRCAIAQEARAVRKARLEGDLVGVAYVVSPTASPGEAPLFQPGEPASSGTQGW
mmetsp:Transcript_7379/g.16169  ORF Transcript_7379/g.16169 Transcript_7379/m.16169 type:complete len:342 (-) Transcript_7379:92-1117(-)